jgi:hypothetical protein
MSIVCIYCEVTKPRPTKGEHLILEGLGGRATTRTVCGDCNNQLSLLDQELLRNTHLALHRFMDPAFQEGEVRAPQFVTFEHGYLDIRLLNTGAADLLPQAALINGGLFVVASEPDQLVLDEVLTALSNGEPACARSVRDVAEHDPPRLVVSRQKRSHLIRARTNEDADRVLAAVRKGVKPAGYAPWDARIKTSLRLSIDVNVPGRCAAKMAYNMAAEVLGSDYMRGRAFKPVRAYILGTNVTSGTGIGENGEEGAIIDYRFVDPWFGDPHPQKWPTNHHALSLGAVGDKLCAAVELFGAIERFWIRLGELGPARLGRLPCLLVRRDDADWWILPRRQRAWRHSEKPMWPSGP